jgi:molybdopterin molybdotransferase
MARFLTLASVEDILAIIRESSPVAARTVPLEAAHGLTLARSFTAAEDLPGFARSTMDGYAVRARDVFGASEGSPALLDCVGECPMGATPSIVVGAGQTARIWTGGMLPEGADAVVMLEYARQAGQQQVELTRPVGPFEHVIQKDEDAAAGQELIPAGRILRPQEIGLLAALGQTVASVREKPRVAVISTGDEVVPAHVAPRPGQVRDINSYTLCALADAAGAEARSFGLAGDDKETLRVMTAEALAWADVALLSGGSSAGRRDYTLEVIQQMPGAAVLAHGVAISPGKPIIVARAAGGKSLWGLPGHAASALVCAEVFIRPLIRQLLGQPETPPLWHGRIMTRLTRSVASAQGRRDYIRVVLEPPSEPDGPLLARPVPGKSGLISTLVQAEALIVCHESLEGLNAGEVVPLHLLL